MTSVDMLHQKIWANFEPSRWKLHNHSDTNVSLRNVITSPDKILPIHKNSIFMKAFAVLFDAFIPANQNFVLRASFKLYWEPFYD